MVRRAYSPRPMPLVGEQKGSLREAGAGTAWEEEIGRRLQMIDAGLAKGRPFAEVVREIDRHLAE
jgi:hypothetical protein